MALSNQDYQLIDFGEGRKLELVGGVLLDRPSPAADNVRRNDPGRWREAQLKFDLQASKQWRKLDEIPEPWVLPIGKAHLLLRPTPFGHIGVFPEQLDNWAWFESLTVPAGEVKRCLNLFAYTGASSLVLASMGWQVTHVDASKPTLLWARENAQASGLAEAPIRWIQEDALRFVDREVRRGNRYDLVLMDPPSYGHGPKGERWSIEDGMVALLQSVFEVLAEQPVGVLWTGHTETEVVMPLLLQVEEIAKSLGLRNPKMERATLQDIVGRSLDFGYRIRWLPRG
jgi:23S rRNA (cytosine1962-C5)-methyltransferase